MFSKLTLGQRGLVLIGVPLLFELSLVGLLSFMIGEVEQAGAAEAHAEEIISTNNEIQHIFIAELVNDTAAAMYTHGAASKEQVRELSKHLIELTDNDPLALENMRQMMDTFRIFDELAGQLHGNPSLDQTKEILIQYLSSARLWKETLLNMRKTRLNIRLINDKYLARVQALTPRTEHAREAAKNVIIGGVVLNLILALALALLFTQLTIQRLDVLMENIERFQEGKDLIATAGGDDEISVLDATFRRMAMERRRAERVRQDLMSMLSHDLRTPLTSLSGHLSLALAGAYGELSGKLRKSLAGCDSEMQRLMRLANDMLEIEKVESGTLALSVRSCEAAALAEEAANALSGLCQFKEITLEQEIEPKMELQCDADRIVEVLVNLLSNAIKFSPKGSCVKLLCKSEDKESVLEVIDQGPGIPKEYQRQVFERFKQLAQPQHLRRDEGSGLGLAICRALVELHGGTIGVRSRPGMGSCFWVRLPRPGKPTERQD